MDKIYLGDGAYVEYDGYSYILTAENGIKATNTIVLDPDAMKMLFTFVEKMKKDRMTKDL